MPGGFVNLFRTFVNAAARIGPAAKLWRPYDEYQEAVHGITWQQKCTVYNRQTACAHAKGGKRKPLLKDRAVTTHIFIDSRTRIKCMLCGLEAWSNSGQDFKFAYMQKLAESSSNRWSASEQVLLEVKKGETTSATFPDTEAGRAALREKFPNWDGTVNPYVLMDVTPEDNGLKIPAGHSPIKGVEASTPEAGPDDLGAIIISARDACVVVQDKWPEKSKDDSGSV